LCRVIQTNMQQLGECLLCWLSSVCTTRYIYLLTILLYFLFCNRKESSLSSLFALLSWCHLYFWLFSRLL
jgi:hypothetical protein